MTSFSGHLTDAQAQRLVDGALLPAETDEVHAHLGACAECQGLVEEYRALGAALEALPEPELPLDFTDAVLARIDARARAAARERRIAAAIVATVLVSLGALVALGAGQWGPGIAQAVERLGAAGRALRLGTDVAAPVLSALRVHIGLACVVVALPLVALLSRLTPARRAEIA